MKELLKSIGGFVLGVILVAAFFILLDLFLFGSAWLSTKVLPILNLIVAGSFFVLLLIILPLSFFRKCRGWCAPAFLYWSYLCGLSLWMFSLLMTLNLWGMTAAVIGLVFAGVGILPVALLACIFNGEWSIFFQLLLQLGILIGCRLFGFYLLEKTEQEEVEEPVAKTDGPNQFMRPWLRWFFVLPSAVGAWIGIQIGVIIVSGIIDIVWTGRLGGLNDTYLVQILNSIAGAWAFVVAGEKTAPCNRGVTALCLTGLFISGNLGAIFFVQASGVGAWEVEWSLICFVVSALTMAAVSYEIFKEGKKERSHGTKERKLKRPPRIVMVDDELMLLDLTEMVIRAWYKEVTVLKFLEGEAAWQELMREDPDLLITDMQRTGMSGWQMLPLLAEQKVKYPILVLSSFADEEDVRKCAGSELNITFLTKPLNIEQFNHVLSDQVGAKTVESEGPAKPPIEQSVKYFIKQPNETEEFSFVATLEEIKAGLKTGRVKPGWGAKKESDGYWLTVHELIHGQPYSQAFGSPLPTTPAAKTPIKTKIIVVTLAMFLLSCLFPPWLNVLDVPYRAHLRTPAGHAFIFSPPDSKGAAWGTEIDLKTLCLEWAALAAILSVVWLIVVKPPWLRDNKSNRSQNFILPPGNPGN